MRVRVRPTNMCRRNNMVTFFTAMFAFVFGCLINTAFWSVDKCPTQNSTIAEIRTEFFLVILVLSAPNNPERRQTMRDTWLRLGQPLRQPYYPEDFIYLPNYDIRGHLEMESVAEQQNRLRLYQDWMDKLQRRSSSDNERNITVKTLFAIGTEDINAALRAKLQKEQAQYNDLLLLPHLQDAYVDLTEKVLHAIDALTHDYDFSYLLKVDDDTYVKLDNLLNELVSYDRKLLRNAFEYRHQPLPQLYWGYFDGRAKIQTSGQWRETKYVLSNHYIPYAVGGGYVLCRKLCEFISANLQHLSTYVSEDVSLGTWLAPLRHVYRRHDPRFDTWYMARICRRQHLVLHKRNQTVMRDLYAGKLCTSEVGSEQKLQRPAEYYYDWTKPADNCCDSIVNY